MKRCAIYTRKSNDENLDHDFNSLDAQREAAELYIKSQQHEGWQVLPDRYDDGGFTGANMNRPALKRLLADIAERKIDVIVVYKIDRLSRSLLDFAKLIEFLEHHSVSMISITQQFNTTTSMGRLTLNILLSFAQFERELTGERIRDTIATAKRKGKYMGGVPPLGYDVDREKKRLIIIDEEAEKVRQIFQRFTEVRSTLKLAKELNELGWKTKSWVTKKGKKRDGAIWEIKHLYKMFNNPIYIGKIKHKDKLYPGEHKAIIEKKLWDEVQKILNEHYRGNSAASKTKTPAMLKGLIRCGHCNAGMGITFTRKKHKKYRYYLCVKADNRGYETCPVKTIPAAEI